MEGDSSCLSLNEENGDKIISYEALLLQLAGKEKDLELAAELGKALLSKNKELMEQRESMVIEYTKKIEVANTF